MSQEDPTLVVLPDYSERFIGGAAIVAAHAKGLGAKVKYFSVVGEDDGAAYIKNELGKLDINSYLLSDPLRPTTIKQRFRSKGKTLLRVNHLKSQAISKEDEEEFLKHITPSVVESDLVIFSDFNYGCVPQGLVDKVSQTCCEKGIMMTADSQSSSQVGDISRFCGMEFVTPTEREARLGTHDFESGLVKLAQGLIEKSNAKHVLLTLGEEGVLIHCDEKNTSTLLTDQLSSFNTNPVDVAGAGDSLLVVSSIAKQLGATIWEAAYLGSLAASVQVSQLGNKPLSIDKLISEVENIGL